MKEIDNKDFSDHYDENMFDKFPSGEDNNFVKNLQI